MKPATVLSLDDHLIAIQRQLYRCGQMINSKSWPSALAALDQISEHAGLAFEIVGAMDAPSSQD